MYKILYIFNFNENNMKKFIKRVIILVVVIFLIDYLFSLLLDFGRPEDYKAFIDSKLSYQKYKKETQILFIGDSHTADAFVPSEIKKLTGKNTFNYGVYHMSPVEGYFILQDLLKRSKSLEYVVLGTNPTMFNRNVTEGKYTPMFIKNYLVFLELLTVTECKNLSVITRSGKKLDLFLPMIKIFFTGHESKTVRNIKNIDRGYLENVKNYTDINDLHCKNKIYKNSKKVIPLQVEYFNKSIRLLKQNNIMVVIANPPINHMYIEDIKNTNVYKNYNFIIDSIAKNNNIEIYNQNQINKNINLINEDFLNGEHLCYTGALKNSTEFAKYFNNLFL